MDDLTRLVERALADFQANADPAALENVKAKYLGKSGELTARLKSSDLPGSSHTNPMGLPEISPSFTALCVSTPIL